jgi:hypothetical protein
MSIYIPSIAARLINKKQVGKTYIATSYVDSSLESRRSVVDRYDESLFSSSRLIAEIDRAIFPKSFCETYDRGYLPSQIGTGRAALVVDHRGLCQQLV